MWLSHVTKLGAYDGNLVVAWVGAASTRVTNALEAALKMMLHP